MVSTCPLFSKSSSPSTNLLEIIPSILITIGIPVTFKFHCFFFNSLARSRYSSLFLLSFIFTPWFTTPAKSNTRQVSLFLFFFFFLLIITMFGFWTRSVCISKSQRISCVSFFRTHSGLCTYHFIICSNLNFLHNSRWITLKPCLSKNIILIHLNPYTCGLVWFLCLMTYKTSLVISCQSHPSSWTVLEEFRRIWGLILFTNPSARAGYDTRSIFKRILTGLNTEFSFS